MMASKKKEEEIRAVVNTLSFFVPNCGRYIYMCNYLKQHTPVINILPNTRMVSECVMKLYFQKKYLFQSVISMSEWCENTYI